MSNSLWVPDWNHRIPKWTALCARMLRINGGLVKGFQFSTVAIHWFDRFSPFPASPSRSLAFLANTNVFVEVVIFELAI